MCVNCVFVSRDSVAVSERERQHEAAELFRMRRHVSQDDTVNLGSFEDLTNAIGRVELPTQVSVNQT